MTLAVALALLLLLLSGHEAQGASQSPTIKKVLRIGWMQNPDSLSPFMGTFTSSYVLYHLNYDFLVGFDSKKMEPRPELATSWSVSPDGKTWTFKIRQGVKWQDGVSLTASDVAFTFNYIVDNQLQNLAAYTAGITGAKVVDDTTVNIYTKAPKANMLAMIVPIIPEHIWSKISGSAASKSYRNSPPIVGSGPFQMVEFKEGKYARLVANKDYWGGAPKIDELLFETYTNPVSMVSDLRLGTLAGAIGVPVAQFTKLRSEAGITTNEGTVWGFNELAMNSYDSPNSLGNPVLLDEEFRHAIAWSIDREAIVRVAMQGYATVGSSLMVPYSTYHWEPPATMAFGYDPAKANSILEAAGYKDVNGDGLRETKQGKSLSLRLAVTSNLTDNQTATKLIAGWLKNVGIATKVEVIDSATLLGYQYNYKGDVFAPDYDMFVWDWTYDVDPQFEMSIYTPQQIEGWNDVCWTDPEYTRLNSLQETTLDQAKRIEIVQKMQEIFYASCPYVILNYFSTLEAYRSDQWSGWVHAPSEYPDFSGAVMYDYMNQDTYRLVQPITASASTGNTSSTTPTIVIALVAAAVVAVIAFLMIRRRRRGAIEE
jgi:peptide/nickel transport system substrate-binding protein